MDSLQRSESAGLERNMRLPHPHTSLDGVYAKSCLQALTPPSSDDGEAPPAEEFSVLTALHVMTTERLALENLEVLYRSDKRCQNNLARAVASISEAARCGGKLVICGMGKSGKVAQKIVATMNSLGITSVFLHPVEALHGDLGMIREGDTILMITFSGKTSELLDLMPHIPRSTHLLVMTSHCDPAQCPLIALHPKSILLSAPIHEPETVSFGLAAPTSSTTVAMALGDSIALAVAQSVHTVPGRNAGDVFRSFHPGGVIGMTSQMQGDHS